jgi:hypothetical protein
VLDEVLTPAEVTPPRAARTTRPLLRVSGARIGSAARPSVDGNLRPASPGVGRRPGLIGMRVHSQIAQPSPAVPTTPDAPYSWEDPE